MILLTVTAAVPWDETSIDWEVKSSLHGAALYPVQQCTQKFYHDKSALITGKKVTSQNIVSCSI